jgi:hypothetical protein
MHKRESQFGNKFRSWIRANPMFAAPYELKQTTTSSIRFDSVSEHQVDCLMACKSDKGFLYKISDQSQGYKPFDFVYYRNSPAYVVIRYPTHFEIIDIETFVKEQKKSKVKSLTSSRAKEISIVSVKIK